MNAEVSLWLYESIGLERAIALLQSERLLTTSVNACSTSGSGTQYASAIPTRRLPTPSPVSTLPDGGTSFRLAPAEPLYPKPP